MAAIRWSEKYRPGNLGEILGNGKATSDLRAWAASWERGAPERRAVILFGPAGVGKTSAALALAKELDWDFIEMNASDQRTASVIDKVAGPASKVHTFSGTRRLLILDEADNLHGTADRGGSSSILRLVRETGQPVLLIANEYYEIDKALRDACLGIQFRSIRTTTVSQALRGICRAEGIDCDPLALERIAELAGGDLRSAVNDLQAATEGKLSLSLEDVVTAERDSKESIFKVLEKVFRGQSAVEALRATYTLDESPEDLIHWIDENIPVAYQGNDLYQAAERLARADVFLGRVRRRQNYELWRYAGFMMTSGVQTSRSIQKRGYLAFKPPSLWRRLGQTRRARNVRDSASSKLARHCHVGTGYARTELLGFLGMLLKNKDLAPKVAALLELNSEEIALVMGSSSSTKKVQTIHEEAQKLLEAEREEKIEMGWVSKGEIGKKASTAPAPPEKPHETEPQKKSPEEKRQRSLLDFS
jgi:replication factor C large subunit